jgi:hypothetical protein
MSLALIVQSAALSAAAALFIFLVALAVKQHREGRLQKKRCIRGQHKPWLTSAEPETVGRKKYCYSCSTYADLTRRDRQFLADNGIVTLRLGNFELPSEPEVSR